MFRRGNRSGSLALILLLFALLCLPGLFSLLKNLSSRQVPAPPEIVSKHDDLHDGGRCAENGGDRGVVSEHDDLLRFHVRAHSNSPGDQKIKNLAAQKILARYRSEWGRCRSAAELSFLLAENSAGLENETRKILRECGCPHDVQVSLVRDIFPARCYEGKLYPPGEYAALYLVIGEGRGENWWCVLFPPLCFSALPSFEAEADDGEAGPIIELPPAGSAQKRSTGTARASGISPVLAADEKNGQGERRKSSGDSVEQEKPTCRWRFWLWEMISNKRR